VGREKTERDRSSENEKPHLTLSYLHSSWEPHIQVSTEELLTLTSKMPHLRDLDRPYTAVNNDEFLQVLGSMRDLRKIYAANYSTNDQLMSDEGVKYLSR